MATEEEVAPYIKEHDGTQICFADTLTQAANALKRESLTNPDDAEKLEGGHLMLFGVEGWTKTGVQGLKGAMKSATNTFQRLEIFGCEIDEAMQKEFADTLTGGNLENVNRLDIDNTQLSAGGAKAIFQHIAEAPQIRVLNLQGSVPTAEVLKEIDDALNEECNIFRSLDHIDLKINDIKAPGCEAVANLMQKMNEHDEVTMDLFYNDIGGDGAQHIARALQAPECFVTVLDLCCNNIGDAGALAIGAALRTNKALKTLKLALNNIGNAGGMSIMAALAPLPSDPNPAVNTTLTHLDMSANVWKEEEALPAPELSAEEKAELEKIDARQQELAEKFDSITDEEREEEMELGKRRGELIKAHVSRPLVTQLNNVCTRSLTLEEFDFTGIEFDMAGWDILAENLKSTVRVPRRTKDPMTVKFSIVDLMSEENLRVVEAKIWNDDLKDVYANIDWRRRETPAAADA